MFNDKDPLNRLPQRLSIANNASSLFNQHKGSLSLLVEGRLGSGSRGILNIFQPNSSIIIGQRKRAADAYIKQWEGEFNTQYNAHLVKRERERREITFTFKRTVSFSGTWSINNDDIQKIIAHRFNTDNDRSEIAVHNDERDDFITITIKQSLIDKIGFTKGRGGDIGTLNKGPASHEGMYKP